MSVSCVYHLKNEPTAQLKDIIQRALIILTNHLHLGPLFVPVSVGISFSGVIEDYANVRGLIYQYLCTFGNRGLH